MLLLFYSCCAVLGVLGLGLLVLVQLACCCARTPKWRRESGRAVLGVLVLMLLRLAYVLVLAQWTCVRVLVQLACVLVLRLHGGRT